MKTVEITLEGFVMEQGGIAALVPAWRVLHSAEQDGVFDDLFGEDWREELPVHQFVVTNQDNEALTINIDLYVVSETILNLPDDVTASLLLRMVADIMDIYNDTPYACDYETSRLCVHDNLSIADFNSDGSNEDDIPF